MKKDKTILLYNNIITILLYNNNLFTHMYRRKFFGPFTTTNTILETTYEVIVNNVKHTQNKQ
jgi:hypothetical protein